MRNFPALKLLLTNTKQPRRSTDLVANVGKLANKYPKASSHILNAMEDIARDAYSIVIKSFVDDDDKQRLKELFEINHGLLVALGVSHPTLEKVRIITDELGVGKTKLTGAGGGGCAITLLNDNVSEETIAELSKKYDEYGFETYETSLGGKGVGFLPSGATKFAFTPEEFLKLDGRDEIEGALEADTLEPWKFW
jgi:mevalonate kinase